MRPTLLISAVIPHPSTPGSGVRSLFPDVCALVFATALALGLGSGCSEKAVPAPPPGPPVYTLCMDASPRLNWWKGRANALAVRVFQLSSLEGFTRADPNRLFDRQVALSGMEGGFIDQTVYPDGRLTIPIVPNPAARYLGLVAGYFEPDPRGSVRVYRELALDGRSGMGQCIQLGSNSIEAP